MTCKDNCYFYGICSEHEGIDFINKNFSPNSCNHFKNKDCIYELPCPLGTTVYKVVFLPEINNRGIIYTPRITMSRFSINDIEDFGVNIFLTQEEAKQALMKLEN